MLFCSEGIVRSVCLIWVKEWVELSGTDFLYLFFQDGARNILNNISSRQGELIRKVCSYLPFVEPE